MRSLISQLGPDFRRARMGVGHPGEPQLVHGYVLGDFHKADQPWVDALLGGTVVYALLGAALAKPLDEKLGGARLLWLPPVLVGPLLLLYPFAPHVTSELWEIAGFPGAIDEQPFPTFDPSALEKDEVELALQVNGKNRSKVVVPAKASKEDIEAAALADERVQQYLEGRTPKKVIVVPGKLVNVVG